MLQYIKIGLDYNSRLAVVFNAGHVDVGFKWKVD